MEHRPVASGVLDGFFLLYTVRAIPAGLGDTVIATPRRIAASIVGGLISWVIYIALRGRTRGTPSRWRFMWLAALSVAAGTAFSAANSLLFYVPLPLTGETCIMGRPCSVEELLRVAEGCAVNWTFLFAAWCLLITWLDSVGEVVDAEGRAFEERAAARIAEIRALRYRSIRTSSSIA